MTYTRRRRLASLAGATVATAALTVVSLSAPAGAARTAGAAGAAGAAPRPGYTRLADSIAPFAGHAQVTGAVSGSVQLTIQVWLRPNSAAAQRYAMAASTPGNPFFRHFLSPAAYTKRFGPSSTTVRKVKSWLRSQGFTAIGTDAQRNYVRATAPVSKINTALGVRMENYQSSASVNAGPYRLRANNQAVTIPAPLSGLVLGVTGLDNAAPVLPLQGPAGKFAHGSGGPASPHSAPCSRYYGQHVLRHLPRQFGTTTFPTVVCGYSGSQLRSAYGANMRNSGRRVTVALTELGLVPDMFLTLQDYARVNHVPTPSASRYTELSLGRGSACGALFDVEEQLDVQTSYDMAPHSNQLVVGGDSCNNGDFGLQGLFDADLAVIDGAGGHPLASICSNSWGPGDDSQPAVLTNIMHAYLVRAAAQGVGMYFASGDGSGVETPDDPFSILVGGTTLGIGQHGQRLFETGWSTGISEIHHNQWLFLGNDGGSSGGPSLVWKQPAYQRGVVPRKLATAPGDRGGLVRSEPDLSADADPSTGFATGLLNFPKGKPPQYFQIDVGGTSGASPLVAGMVAAAQQGQRKAFGFIDPVLYRLAGTRAFHDVLPLTRHIPARFHGAVCFVKNECFVKLLLLFDDQRPGMFTTQVTLPGYDNMTGIGSPNGQHFIAALRKLRR